MKGKQKIVWKIFTTLVGILSRGVGNFQIFLHYITPPMSATIRVGYHTTVAESCDYFLFKNKSAFAFAQQGEKILTLVFSKCNWSRIRYISTGRQSTTWRNFVLNNTGYYHFCWFPPLPHSFWLNTQPKSSKRKSKGDLSLSWSVSCQYMKIPFPFE